MQGLTPLQPQDLIAIVSPSGPLRDSDIQPMLDWFAAEGYRTRVMPRVHGRWRYLAATDEERADDLQSAFFDPEVRAVVCSRGGYGCSRLLPKLDLDRIAATCKPFLGFSDITTLHLALNRRGLPTLHGPMGGHIGKWSDSWPAQSLRGALGGTPTIPPNAPKGETVVGGKAGGIVVGGCLSLLGDSLGTPDAFDGRGKIVLIEDVGEPPYRVDARLTHLLNSGSLDGVAGLVLGEMTGTDERTEEACEGCSWKEIVMERLAPIGAPMVWRFPFGHIPNALTLPLGLEAVLDADAGTLTYA